MESAQKLLYGFLFYINLKYFVFYFILAPESFYLITGLGHFSS